MLAHDSESAIGWAQRAIELASALGDVATQSHALNNRGSAYLVAYDPAGWADLRESLALALDHGLQEHAARAFTNLSFMATAGRRHAEGADYLHRGLRYCELHDLDSWRLYMLAVRSRARLEQGDWEGAADDANSVLQHPQTASVTRLPALITLAQLRIRRGDPGADALLEEARGLAIQADELQRMGPLAAALAEAAWLSDDMSRIVSEVQPVYELALKSRDPWIKGELASWLQRAGAPGDIPSDIAEPYALEISGDGPGAARVWAGLGCRYEQALALASSTDDDAQRDALMLLDTLGASATAQALRRRMRARGVRRIPRGVRTSTRTHQLGLTRREAQVLALIAEGLRNSAIAKRLFLSTKTVDHHVSAVFRKLDVSSREDAVALARKLGAANTTASSDAALTDRDPPTAR
jgi:ATP/maltotriose-dependent transcriptional regulator MalT